MPVNHREVGGPPLILNLVKLINKAAFYKPPGVTLHLIKFKAVTVRHESTSWRNQYAYTLNKVFINAHMKKNVLFYTNGILQCPKKA